MDFERLANDFLDALDQRDGSRLGSLMDGDIAYDPGDGTAGEARIIGAESVRDALIERSSALDESHGDRVVMTSATNNRVAVETTLRGRYGKTLDGLPAADGQSYALAAVIVMEWSGGRLSRVSRFIDREAFAGQLG